MGLNGSALSRLAQNNISHPIVLSGKTPQALGALADSFQNWLATRGGNFSLEDLSYSTCVLQAHQEHRVAFNADSPKDLKAQLANFIKMGCPSKASSLVSPTQEVPLTAFVYTGQGPKWSIERDLLERETVFRKSLERCDHHWRRLSGGSSLLNEIFIDPMESRLHLAQPGQPGIFALQVALTALWESWGIRPNAVVGHSIGEVAAAHIAGILSLEDALKVVYHRSRIHQRMTGKGRMLAVRLSPREVFHLLEEYSGLVSPAVQNSPDSCILAGEPWVIKEIHKRVEDDNVFCRLLDVEYAYHSYQMDPHRAELISSLEGIKPSEESIPFYSTVTAGKLHGEELGAKYWGRNFREPVLFAKAIERLGDSLHSVFLELGPQPLLDRSIKRVLDRSKRKSLVLTSLRRGLNSHQSLHNALGHFYAHGSDINWDRLFPFGGKVISLPQYSWQRKRHWLGKGQGMAAPEKIEDYL